MAEEKKDKLTTSKSLTDMQLMPDWNEEEEEAKDAELEKKLVKERKTQGRKMMKGME